MQREVGKQHEHDRHALGMLQVAEEVRREKTEKGQQRVRAGDHRVLVHHEIAERQQPAQWPGKRRKEDEEGHARRCERQSNWTESSVRSMKDVLRDPQDEVPQTGAALITQLVRKNSPQAKVACDQPGLGFVGPLFVIGQSEPCDGDPKPEHAEVSNSPPIRRRRRRGCYGPALAMCLFRRGERSRGTFCKTRIKCLVVHIDSESVATRWRLRNFVAIDVLEQNQRCSIRRSWKCRRVETRLKSKKSVPPTRR